MSKKAIIIGGTGATGRQLISQLLQSDNWDKVTSIARRPVINGQKHEKLDDIVIDSMNNISSTREIWNGHDVFFNCIGTTRQKSGGAKEFIEVELGISSIAAKLACDAKISHASIISASGANHEQWAVDWVHPLLYVRIIGMKEQTVIQNEFKKVSIFRPGMLIRMMDESRFSDKILKFIKIGLSVKDLASAMKKNAQYEDEYINNEMPMIYSGNYCIKQLIYINGDK